MEATLATSQENEEPLHEYKHSQLDLDFSSLDSDEKYNPKLSTRLDLQTKLLWRQFVRSQKTKDRYNPESPKKINDGIDFDLYRYLFEPVLIVATDAGFFEKIADIESFQKNWFYRPENLSNEWKRGIKPKPQWP